MGGMALSVSCPPAHRAALGAARACLVAAAHAKPAGRVTTARSDAAPPIAPATSAVVTPKGCAGALGGARAASDGRVPRANVPRALARPHATLVARASSTRARRPRDAPAGHPTLATLARRQAARATAPATARVCSRPTGARARACVTTAGVASTALNRAAKTTAPATVTATTTASASARPAGQGTRASGRLARERLRPRCSSRWAMARSLWVRYQQRCGWVVGRHKAAVRMARATRHGTSACAMTAGLALAALGVHARETATGAASVAE